MRHSNHLEFVTGLAEFDRLCRDETFLDFVSMCSSNGARRHHNAVAFSSSDPSDVALAAHWIRRLSATRPSYQLRFDEDHDLVELVRFWARRLCVNHERIRLRSSPPHGGPAADSAGSRYGVLTVSSNDAVLGIRLHAWLDRVRREGPAADRFEFDGLPAV